MEHAVRALNERWRKTFYESEQLDRIIRELRGSSMPPRLAGGWRSCSRSPKQRIAAQHGLSPVSFAVYELLAPPWPREKFRLLRTEPWTSRRRVARAIERAIQRGRTLSRDAPGYQAGAAREELVRGRDRMAVRFGESTRVCCSAQRRRKTVQITVDGGGVQARRFERRVAGDAQRAAWIMAAAPRRRWPPRRSAAERCLTWAATCVCWSPTSGLSVRRPLAVPVTVNGGVRQSQRALVAWCGRRPPAN